MSAHSPLEVDAKVEGGRWMNERGCEVCASSITSGGNPREAENLHTTATFRGKGASRPPPLPDGVSLALASSDIHGSSADGEVYSVKVAPHLDRAVDALPLHQISAILRNLISA